jgi:hypothetical protein
MSWPRRVTGRRARSRRCFRAVGPRPDNGLALENRAPQRAKNTIARNSKLGSAHGHQRRFKRKPRTSASPTIPDMPLGRIDPDARRGAADDGELRQVAAAAA